MRTVDDGRGLELSQSDINTLDDIFQTCADEEYFSSTQLRVLGRILTWLENGYLTPTPAERAEDEGNRRYTGQDMLRAEHARVEQAQQSQPDPEPEMAPIGRLGEDIWTRAEQGIGTWAGVQRSTESIWRAAPITAARTISTNPWTSLWASTTAGPVETITWDSETTMAAAARQQNEDNDH